MKVENYIDKTVVYLIDEKEYNKDDIKKTLVKVFNELNKYYDYEFSDSYRLILYQNKNYGMILEIYNNDEKTDEDIVNLKLNILKDTLFLYEIEDALDFIDSEMYYYDGRFYISTDRIDFKLLENSTIIYGDEVYKIIGRGIKL